MHYTVYLKTHGSCQLNCAHCMTNGKNGIKQSFDLDKTIDWFNRLHSYLPSQDEIHVELHGGEPLLAPLESLIAITEHLRGLERRLTVGITTNLTLKIGEPLEAFLLGLDGIGTSWDKDIRFDNNKQELLWYNNVKSLIPKCRYSVLNISLSKTVLQMNPGELVHWANNLGFNAIAFERITFDGLALLNNDVIPDNQSINQWYLRLHHSVQKLGLREKISIRNLEDVYAKFERGDSGCGTFCRDCEQKLFTLNVDGTIGGCPNTATAHWYGNMDDSIETLFNQPKRIQVMVKESMRNPVCYECPVFDVCGSDCHQLKWNGKVCPAPKQLMQYLKENTERIYHGDEATHY